MLRVTLVRQKMGREISARALLDSGAKGIIVDHEFAKHNKLTLHTLAKPIPVKNVDVKPAAGRRATSDFSCGLIDKWTEGPLEMRVDC